MQNTILRMVIPEAVLTHCIFPTKYLKKNVMVNRCCMMLGRQEDCIYLDILNKFSFREQLHFNAFYC